MAECVSLSLYSLSQCSSFSLRTSGSVCSIPKPSVGILSSPGTSCAYKEPDKKPYKQRSLNCWVLQTCVIYKWWYRIPLMPNKGKGSNKSKNKKKRKKQPTCSLVSYNQVCWYLRSDWIKGEKHTQSCTRPSLEKTKTKFYYFIPFSQRHPQTGYVTTDRKQS